MIIMTFYLNSLAFYNNVVILIDKSWQPGMLKYTYKLSAKNIKYIKKL